MSETKSPLLCEHDNRIWTPVVISRWSDPRLGVTKQMTNVRVCFDCTNRIKLRDVVTDEGWSMAQKMLRRNGQPPLQRHLNQLRWENADDVQKEFKSAQDRVIDRETPAAAEPSR